MSILDTIITQRVVKPPRIFLYGIEGIGKTTFGASAPRPIFIQAEDGADFLNVPRFPLIHSVQEALDQLEALAIEPHDYQTVVIDSADWLENYIHEQVCADYHVRSINAAAGGYGRGYEEALKYWKRILALLTTLREKRSMAVILLAHHQVKAVGDPEYPEYQQYQPRLQDKAMHKISEWVDATLFATRKMRVDENGKASPIGAAGGDRILRCVGSPTCIAKSRYNLPAEIPLRWEDFLAAYTECVRSGNYNPDVPPERSEINNPENTKGKENA